ncbi:hypothetical protein VFPPC_15256 [Pochonia chlamydosporia 170]|uniref:Uncharacterized protein n=1 Tax=Pochonia chlamydosporia 170 TaxID=1380566 RepID=A0A179G5M4_METCM|nr:hypothetical protein VFPPC_15256 [Pochonia chlamydosporia 170]OAQ73125.1 hypothetical protein VFPPC_15256 [Pochonia chlamydosporia 170]
MSPGACGELVAKHKVAAAGREAEKSAHQLPSRGNAETAAPGSPHNSSASPEQQDGRDECNRPFGECHLRKLRTPYPWFVVHWLVCWVPNYKYGTGSHGPFRGIGQEALRQSIIPRLQDFNACSDLPFKSSSGQDSVVVRPSSSAQHEAPRIRTTDSDSRLKDSRRA